MTLDVLIPISLRASLPVGLFSVNLGRSIDHRLNETEKVGILRVTCSDTSL